MKCTILLQVICLTGVTIAQSPANKPPKDATAVQDVTDKSNPPMLGLHWSRDFDPGSRASSEASDEAHTQGRPQKSPDMTYHGGKILTTAVTEAIFWGTSWASSPGDKITGMDAWYTGFNQSNYAKTSDEYTGSNGQVSDNTIYLGHVLDNTASKTGNNTATILAEVCKMVPSPDKSGNGYYAVYSDTPRGGANYCAYHSYGSCNGVPLQFAYFFKLDGDPGCDPQDTSGLHSQGLAALANVSGHELSEARSDPASPAAWYDAQGEENGDKCAWTFGAPLVTFANGSEWKIQGEWSNAAYNAGTGYLNSSGQKGCLSGL